MNPTDTGGLPIEAYAVEYKEAMQNWNEARRRVWPQSRFYDTIYIFFDKRNVLLMIRANGQPKIRNQCWIEINSYLLLVAFSEVSEEHLSEAVTIDKHCMNNIKFQIIHILFIKFL